MDAQLGKKPLPPLNTSKLQAFEEAESLFDPPVELGMAAAGTDERARVWVTPGDSYSVTVTLPPPFLGLVQTQTRTLNWELDPFVFYAVRTVRAAYRRGGAVQAQARVPSFVVYAVLLAPIEA